MGRVEDNDIRRVLRMEELFIRAKLMIDQVEDVDELDDEVCWEFMKLDDYFESPEWQEDHERYERGEFPDGLLTDVLSEDAIYDLLERYRELGGYL